jgi:hypothetical protein
LSKRKCKQCKDYSETFIKLPGGVFCTIDHAMEFANSKRDADRARQIAKAMSEHTKQAKTDRAKHRADLKRVRRNPRAEALLAAQLLARVSAADDDGYCTCVTCDHVGKWNDGFDGGHFIAKGSSSYWSLDPRNIHPQCKPCNGNGMKFGITPIAYTAWMTDNYGREFVDHMTEVHKTITKRSVVFYDEFIAETKKQIGIHKKRING